MGGSTRRVLGTVAAIAVPFAAPVIGGAIASSIGVSSALGTAAVSAGTGAVLGGASSALAGGDFRTGAIAGGVGGGVGALAAPVIGSALPAATPSWVTSGITSALAGGAGAAAAGQDWQQAALMSGLTGGVMDRFTGGQQTAGQPDMTATGVTDAAQPISLSGPTTTVQGTTVGSPGAATGATGLLQAQPGTSMGTMNLAGTTAMSPTGMTAPAAQTPALGLTAPTTGSAAPSMMQLSPQQIQAATSPAQPVSLAGAGPSQFIQDTFVNNQMSQPALSVSTMPSNVLQTAMSAPQPGSIADGTVIASNVQDDPGLFRRVAGELGERFTSPDRWADFTMLAGMQLLSAGMMPDIPDMPEFPDPEMVNIDEILAGLSPEERELYEMQLEELRNLAEQDQQLFSERMNLARGLMGEADYFDPDYWGQMQQRATRTAMQRQERERRREEALGGGAASDARARQAALDTALAGETAYLQGADFAQQQRLRTLQSAESIMPQTGPRTVADYSPTLTGMTGTGYSRLTDQYNQQAALNQSLFDRYMREVGMARGQAQDTSRMIAGLTGPFMGTA